MGRKYPPAPRALQLIRPSFALCIDTHGPLKTLRIFACER